MEQESHFCYRKNGNRDEGLRYCGDTFYSRCGYRDTIPAIESKYSTYAGKDTSVEGLQKSRDHRAFAGFSMGSFTTIQAAMMRNLDFGAMSGSLTELSDFKDVLESEEYKDLPIHYMYNGNGANDIAHDEHKELCIDILAEMSDRFVDGENFAWIDYEGGYRNAKRIIFSDDGLIFYTEDHYESFEQLY